MEFVRDFCLQRIATITAHADEKDLSRDDGGNKGYAGSGAAMRLHQWAVDEIERHMTSGQGGADISIQINGFDPKLMRTTDDYTDEDK